MKRIIERRANRWYIQAGPSKLVAPATRNDLQRALIEMQRQQHVNRQIVAEHLEKFAREHGVLRTYAYLGKATNTPARRRTP